MITSVWLKLKSHEGLFRLFKVKIKSHEGLFRLSYVTMAISQAHINSLLSLITVRLDDGNFVRWSFQLQSVLEGEDLFGYLDGTYPCPPRFVITEEGGVTTEVTTASKQWNKTDKALIGLITATLSDEAIEYVVGSRTSREVWLSLQRRYSTISRASIMQLKTDLQTMKKGGDSIEKYLLRIKHARDQLTAVGVKIFDEDIIVVTLSGLSEEYNMVKAVIRGRETPIDLQEFRAQLLAAERDIECSLLISSHSLSGLVAKNEGNTLSRRPHLPNNNDSNNDSWTVGNGNRVSSGGNNGFQGGRPTGGYNNGNYTRNRSYDSNSGYNNRAYDGRNRGYERHNTWNSNRGYNGGRTNWNGTNHGNDNWHGGNWRSGNGGGIPECQICSKRGHTAVNCFYRNNNPQNNASSSIVECQICGKKGHAALDCFHRSNYAYQGQAPPQTLTAMNAHAAHNFGNADFWIADTGATHHMTPDMRNLTTATPFETNAKITVGSGEGLDITHIGTSYIGSPSHPLQLKNVLLVPKLAANLLSLNRLCYDNNCNILLDDSALSVQDKATRKVVLKGKSSRSLYPIPTSSSHSSTNFTTSVAFLGQAIRSSLWHHRLGHLSNVITSRMLSIAKVPFTPDSSLHVCSSCLSGKMSRLPFSTKSNKSDIPFYKVHTDVWGPAPCVSIDGYRYYVLFVDECTRFTWIYPLINKSDVFLVFVQFLAFVSNQFNASVKILQSDGGGEYVSKNFKSFLASKGILHYISCPYTPQQNGLAERKHRHIVETSITLMSAASIPRQFWFHAFSHSTFLINKMPCESLSMVSPYAKLFGIDPDILSLRIFGTACYPYLRHYNSNKLEPRTS